MFESFESARAVTSQANSKASPGTFWLSLALGNFLRSWVVRNHVSQRGSLYLPWLQFCGVTTSHLLVELENRFSIPMAVSFESLLWLTVVGILWGGTNPFLKRGATGVDKAEGGNFLIRTCKDIYFLISNWRYMLPFLLNQSGSLVYFLTLQNTEMSLAVPISNSLTFVFTAISGWFLGEEKPNLKMLTGIALVLSGISLCVFDKAFTVE